mmetsp:Transcript_21036/g.23421  ORF Transcript_21036/g.23421 Transcript_21036/m.23421 type:complete len:104 (+) Transcript_21036:278-589(+)
MDINKNYDALMGPNWDEAQESEASQKQSLLGQNATLSDQNHRLKHAIKVGNEAEVVAKDTMINLEAGTNKMHNIRDNIGRVNKEMTLSDKLLDIIKKNESRNR